MSQDLFDTEDVTSSKSVRKSVNSSRRRKNDDIDLDNFGLESSNFDSVNVNMSLSRPPQPQPRRNSKTTGEDEGNVDSVFGRTSSTRGKPVSKAMDGWGDEKSTRSRSPKFGRVDLNQSVDKSLRDSTSLKQQNRREITDAEELDIPEIPDLEETIDPNDNNVFKIAEAPDIQVHQISTYRELDKEFFKEKAFQFLEGNIDVSLLHCGLSTEQLIAEEEDVVWDWTKLFTEVVSLLTADHQETDPFSLTANGHVNGDTVNNELKEFEILNAKPARTTQPKREMEF